jgi:hypothetical protein
LKIVGYCLFLFFKTLDAFDEGAQLAGRNRLRGIRYVVSHSRLSVCVRRDSGAAGQVFSRFDARPKPAGQAVILIRK